jgi:hypothetical protein
VALHGTSSGSTPIEQILFAWAMMLIFSAIYLFIASKLFKKMLVKARTDATLNME